MPDDTQRSRRSPEEIKGLLKSQGYSTEALELLEDLFVQGARKKYIELLSDGISGYLATNMPPHVAKYFREKAPEEVRKFFGEELRKALPEEVRNYLKTQRSASKLDSIFDESEPKAPSEADIKKICDRAVSAVAAKYPTLERLDSEIQTKVDAAVEQAKAELPEPPAAVVDEDTVKRVVQEELDSKAQDGLSEGDVKSIVDEKIRTSDLRKRFEDLFGTPGQTESIVGMKQGSIYHKLKWLEDEINRVDGEAGNAAESAGKDAAAARKDADEVSKRPLMSKAAGFLIGGVAAVIAAGAGGYVAYKAAENKMQNAPVADVRKKDLADVEQRLLAKLEGQKAETDKYVERLQTYESNLIAYQTGLDDFKKLLKGLEAGIKTISAKDEKDDKDMKKLSDSLAAMSLKADADSRRFLDALKKMEQYPTMWKAELGKDRKTREQKEKELREAYESERKARAKKEKELSEAAAALKTSVNMLNTLYKALDLKVEGYDSKYGNLVKRLDGIQKGVGKHAHPEYANPVPPPKPAQPAAKPTVKPAAKPVEPKKPPTPAPAITKPAPKPSGKLTMDDYNKALDAGDIKRAREIGRQLAEQLAEQNRPVTMEDYNKALEAGDIKRAREIGRKLAEQAKGEGSQKKPK